MIHNFGFVLPNPLPRVEAFRLSTAVNGATTRRKRRKAGDERGERARCRAVQAVLHAGMGVWNRRQHNPKSSRPPYSACGSPNWVQKERMAPEDMYVLSAEGSIISSPLPGPAPQKPRKCSECGPLFLKAYQMRNAGAVIHSHGITACLATMINPSAKEFRVTHMEMIKGIDGHGYYDELVVPIIENTAREYELTDSLAAAISAYPKTTAVLVRNHGVYVWGDSWITAKTQAECYHYLFEAAIELHRLGLDPADARHGPLARSRNVSSFVTSGDEIVTTATSEKEESRKTFPRAIVLDIEGTTTPISFVTEVLFPYAVNNVEDHLQRTYDSDETKSDIELLRKQAYEDLIEGVSGIQQIPGDGAGKGAVIEALKNNVLHMVTSDRKVTALKQLQGHIWRTGYAKRELEAQVFEDVPQALKSWHTSNTKVYIYSSGSREAQRLIFAHTKYGDLRPYLSGFFDTTTGNKRESRSYSEISLSVGVDHPSQITFATDVLAEAVAAKQAGLEAVLVVRPGNAPLPETHGFRTLTSLVEL